MNIGDSMYHPCSMDIIEHKVIGISTYDDFTHYHLKAVRPVGACGKVKVTVDQHKDKFRFVELKDEDEIEYASGLQDFVEGNYFATLDEARLERLSQQHTLAWSNMDNKERLYKEAKARYEQVDALVKELTQEINN